MNAHEESSLFKYILGQLAEAEREAIESRIFVDDDFLEHLEAAETELVRDYLRDELRGTWLRSFEQEIKKNPHLQRRVESLRIVMQAVANLDQAMHEAIVSRRISIAPWHNRFAVAWAIALLLVAPSVWLVHQNAELRGRLARTATEQKPRPSRQFPDQPPMAAPSQTISVLLAPGLVRGAGRRSESLAISPGIRQIELRLDVADLPKFGQYRATITSVDEPRRVWAGVGIRMTSGSGRVIVVVNALALQRSDYIVLLEGVGATGDWEPCASYVFRIVK
jgi:hypothetical protein